MIKNWEGRWVQRQINVRSQGCKKERMSSFPYGPKVIFHPTKQRKQTSGDHLVLLPVMLLETHHQLEEIISRQEEDQPLVMDGLILSTLCKRKEEWCWGTVRPKENDCLMDRLMDSRLEERKSYTAAVTTVLIHLLLWPIHEPSVDPALRIPENLWRKSKSGIRAVGYIIDALEPTSDSYFYVLWISDQAMERKSS